MSEKEYSFQKTYTLSPQSPLIHFQPDARGTSLRATEVKPKLDAFLMMRYQKLHGEQLPGDWFNPAAKAHNLPALDYKLRIEQQKLLSAERLGIGTDYDIFYGNMVSAKDKKKPRSEPLTEKKGLMIEEKMTVICFKPDLMQWIGESIGEFFIVTNFGTMQNKGFGSFLVQETKYNAKEIANLLTMYSGAKHCYSFRSDSQTVFKKIKLMYAIIKSGVNLGEGKGMGGKNYIDSFLFDYVQKELSKPIDHEKACVKASGVAPAVKKVGTTMRFNDKKQKDVPATLFDTDTEPPRKDPNYRYVRALFGIGKTVTYNDVNVPDGEPNKVNVKIEHDYKTDQMKEEDRIARFPSPVFFKIIHNNVYFVGTPIDDIIYGKTFIFSAEGRGKVSVRVPLKSELPADFINDFMEYAFARLTAFIHTRTRERAFKILNDVDLRRLV